MNHFTSTLREKQTPPVRVVINGDRRPHIKGIAIMPGYGPSELRDAKVGVPANGLAEYLKRESGPEIGLDLVESLKRLQNALDDYRFRAHVPAEPSLVTLDVATQQMKWFLHGKYKNTRTRAGLSSSGDDYFTCDALFKAADTLSYYLEPLGDKVVVRFLRGLKYESQIKMEGHMMRPVPDEVKNAVVALLGLAGAELLPNGSSYMISIPKPPRVRTYSHRKIWRPKSSQ